MQGFLEQSQIAQVVRQEQDQRRIELLALLVGQVAVGVDQRFVEVVRRGEAGVGDKHGDNL